MANLDVISTSVNFAKDFVGRGVEVAGGLLSRLRARVSQAARNVVLPVAIASGAIGCIDEVQPKEDDAQISNMETLEDVGVNNGDADVLPEGRLPCSNDLSTIEDVTSQLEGALAPLCESDFESDERLCTAGICAICFKITCFDSDGNNISEIGKSSYLDACSDSVDFSSFLDSDRYVSFVHDCTESEAVNYDFTALLIHSNDVVRPTGVDGSCDNDDNVHCSVALTR